MCRPTVHLLLGSLAAILLAACTGPTEGTLLLRVKITEQQLENEDLAVWPMTPEASGGLVLTVRGTIRFGCRTPIAFAELQADRVSIRIGGRDVDPGRCRAETTGWHGYELTVPGLPAGYYDVLVAEDGKPRQYRSRVRIAD